MKKIIGLFSVAIAFTFISCSNQPAETKKEVIVVPAPVEKPAPVIIVKDPPAKSTSISVDKNGVKVETKKVNVDVKPN
jgi:hypothetical protein